MFYITVAHKTYFKRIILSPQKCNLKNAKKKLNNGSNSRNTVTFSIDYLGFKTSLQMQMV